MRKTQIFKILIFIALLNVSLTALSKETVKKESFVRRTLNINKGFTGLKSSNGIDIIYTQDNKLPVAHINGPSEIVNKMTWEVDSRGVLTFSMPKNIKGYYKGEITIQLNGRLLKNYEAVSSGMIDVTTPVKIGEKLNFAVSSSGSVILRKEVEASGKEINIAGASSGNVVFLSSVRCESINISLASSSTVRIPVLINSLARYAGSSTGILELGNIIMKKFDVVLASGAECNVKEGKIQNLDISSVSGGEFIGNDIKLNDMDLKTGSGGTITIKGEGVAAEMAAASGGFINVAGMNIANIKSKKVSSGGKIEVR